MNVMSNTVEEKQHTLRHRYNEDRLTSNPEY
jgi:hypothetical protein